MITGAAGGIGAATAALFEREGARVAGVDLRAHDVGDLSLQADVTDEERVAGMYRARARGARRNRRAVQQRRHLTHRRRLGARHLDRGVGAGPGGQPAQRLSVLQARHPSPAPARQRLGDQHRLVRGRARAPQPRRSPTRPRRAASSRSRASSGSSSPGGGCASTRSVRARSTRPCCASSTPRIPSRRPAGSSTCPWAASPAREEIANAALFLASDESSFITASTFLVDGGISGAYTTPM